MSALGNICGAKGHVRFAPNCDRESGFPQTVMSALLPEADMCGALGDVCYGPKADIATPLFGQLIGCFTLRHSRLIGTHGKLTFEASLNPVGSDRYAECAAICET
jgi:hypothetical protein